MAGIERKVRHCMIMTDVWRMMRRPLFCWNMLRRSVRRTIRFSYLKERKKDYIMNKQHTGKKIREPPSMGFLF